MPFMVPTYRSGLWAIITDRNGESQNIPSEHYDPKDWPIGHTVEHCNAVGVCLSAPGYLDRTDWDLYDNATEARSYFLDIMEVCPACGESTPLDSDPSMNHCPACGEPLF